VRGQVCIISFPNVPVISQHDLNSGLELANPGMLCVGIKESSGGTISLMSRLTPVYTIYGLRYPTFGLAGLAWPVGSTGTAN
jgi:hypothetical protein